MKKFIMFSGGVCTIMWLGMSACIICKPELYGKWMRKMFTGFIGETETKEETNA